MNTLIFLLVLCIFGVLVYHLYQTIQYQKELIQRFHEAMDDLEQAVDEFIENNSK